MVIIGSDHSGVELKNKIIGYLKNNNIECFDISPINELDDDYPDIAKEICSRVLQENGNLGIAICGTGIGMSISCNKIKGIRAALCTNEYMSKMSRMHNDANVLCLGARLDLNIEEIYNIVKKFIYTDFSEDRHTRRLLKIKKLEGEE